MACDANTIKQYVRHISRFPLLTIEQEVELAAQVQAGAEEARSKLVQSNLRLVVKIAHDFRGCGLPLPDLISEGNIGLVRAVERFDPAKGAKLSSYAAWWIKQFMRRALTSKSHMIRIPAQSAVKICRIENAGARLTEELGREPTNAEIAAALGFPEKTVANLRRARTATVSLDAPISSGEAGEYCEIIPDDDAASPDEVAEREASVRYLLKLVDQFDEQKREILKFRFGLHGERPRTLEEVSNIIGLTRERIRQIQNKALHELRTMCEKETLTALPAMA